MVFKGLHMSTSSRDHRSEDGVPPFTLTLSHNDHRNTVIYGPDWEPMYHIETRPCHTAKVAPTMVFRQDDGGQIYLIASIEFGDPDRFEEDIVTYGGIRQPLSWLLPRRVAGRRRCMFTSSEQWTWTRYFSGIKLCDQSNSRKAKYRRNTFRAAKSTIEVADEALPYLDLIVVGWIVVCRDIEKDSQEARATSGHGG